MIKMLRSLAIAVAVIATGASAAELKIGVVNTDRLFQQSAPAQKINKRLQDEFSKKDANLQQMRQQLKDLQNDLEKNDATLSDSDKAKKQAQIRDLNTRYQRSEREFREDLNTRQGEEMAKLQELAIKAVRQLAETEKFDLILQGQDLAYVSPRVDVTDKILKLMGDK